MAALLTDPARFDGKSVTLHGWAVLAFEHHGIFADRESARHGFTENGFWLDLPDGWQPWKGTAPRLVEVDAVFVNGPQGHLGAWNGALKAKAIRLVD
ncbi:MAG: hypothetical protein IT175_04030 [Acidobacteria bacterium]|nr:hypothetical protein [Acidobacteriota bacterium]